MRHSAEALVTVRPSCLKGASIFSFASQGSCVDETCQPVNILSLVTLPSVHNPCLNGLYWRRRVAYRIMIFFSIIPSKYIITRHSSVKKSFSSPPRFLFNSSFIFIFIQGYTQLHKQGNCPKLGWWRAPSSWSCRPLDMTPFEHLLPFGHKTLQAHLVLPLLQMWIRHFSRSPDLLQWGMAFWGWHWVAHCHWKCQCFQLFPRREKSISFYSWVRMDISISNFTWPFFS